MSASEFSESSNMESPLPQDSPYSSPSQQVPHLASAFSGITCGDDVSMHVDGTNPYLRIMEHPQDHFRFRYKSEMVGTHGCLLGKNTALNRTRTHPTVELVNYTGKAVIRVQLAQVDKDDEHPHKLLEDEEDREVSTVVPQQGSYKVGFAGMGIIHTAKKDVASLLLKKLMNKFENSKTVPAKDLNNLRGHCDNVAKTINLNIVRLRFSAHDITTDKEICPPVFSEPIHNMKSAATNDLKICRISRYFGRPRGGDDVFILVEKVNKKNIVIRFFELNEYGEEVWTANGNFLQSDVHHQFAIVFRTPPYRDPQITKDVKVYIELVRPSDGRTSERKEFMYKAEQVFKQNKRRRVNSTQSSICSSSGGSIKSMNDVPVTVGMLDHSDRTEENSNVPVYHINIPHIPVAAAPASELADALLYGAGGAGGAGEAGTAPVASPLVGGLVPEPPVLSLNSAELDRLINHDPDLAADERRPYGQMDWAEYMQSFGDSLSDKTQNSMDFLRTSMQLVTDSGKGKGVIKEEPRSPSKSPPRDERKQNIADMARTKNEYNAYYNAEDGKEVKKLVQEICEIIKNKSRYKRLVVKDKLERLFEKRLSNGDTFLHMALASNQPSLEYVIELVHSLRLPQLLQLRNDLQQTVLHLAIIHDLPRLVPKLIAKGCDPMAADAEGNSALHYAVVCGACLEPLLGAIRQRAPSCDLNAVNNEKQTALHLAAVYDSASSVELLMEHGCSGQARDAAGRTPLHLALYDDCLAAARALLQRVPESDIDAVDSAGNTALQILSEKDNVCSEKQQAIVQMLLEKKADAAGAAGARLAARWPALRALLPPAADDIKSEPEDDFESADEGECDEAPVSWWLAGVAARLDAGGWRALARRLLAGAPPARLAASPSPTRSLFMHLKESGENISSKSLAMHLQDMGEIEAANIIRKYIE